MSDVVSLITSIPFGGTQTEIVVYSIVLSCVAIAVYAFKSIGLYTLARRETLPVWMAFVPFFNDYLLCKIAGECSFLRMKIKKCGLWYILADALYSVAQIFSVVPKIILRDYYVSVDSFFYQYDGFPDYLAWADTADSVMGYVEPIVSLVFLFFSIAVFLSFFRKYALRNSVPLTFAAALFPVVSGILIFAVRNNAVTVFRTGYASNREEYYREQQKHYDEYRREDRYGQPNEDPFSEFSKDDDKNKKSHYSDNDEFFN